MKIVNATEEEINYIEEKITEHNNECLPFTQEKEYIQYSFVIKDDNKVIAGVNMYYVGWMILYVDSLWVDKNYRRQGLATKLMNKVIEKGKEDGSNILTLSTFDFQGKDLYDSLGFELIGVLEDAPKGHAEYFYRKVL